MSSVLTKIPITKPSITELEIAYVNDAIRHGWGERCYDYINKFERNFASYIGSSRALATSSCTGAIHLALMALGVKPGDEVIVPEITWIASVEPVLYIGAKPVFVDVLPDTWCIDPAQIERSITKKTKAIIVVHVYGNLANMNEIMAIAKKYDLQVLEDAAEALGSEYHDRKAGSLGDAGVFSFHGTKTMTTGEGGMLVTNRADVFEKAKILNDHGRNPSDPEHKMFWMRDYGYKYKISNLQAALGCAQIQRINELVEKKRTVFNWYFNLMRDIPCIMNPELEGTKNSYWMPTIVFDESIDFDRVAFFTKCHQNRIDSRPFFYPLSSLPMFHVCRENIVAYGIHQRAINLPSYHDLTKQDSEFVAATIKSLLQ